MIKTLPQKPLSDMQLHNDFVRYGGFARHYVRKCLAMIPEIYSRRIYAKKGFGDIYEYARKLAGLSDAQVKRAIALELKFSDCPHLRAMLISGKVGMSKLARVASIATPENDQELAQKVKTLPQSALETLVQDEQKMRYLPNPKLGFGVTFVRTTHEAQPSALLPFVRTPRASEASALAQIEQDFSKSQFGEPAANPAANPAATPEPTRETPPESLFSPLPTAVPSSSPKLPSATIEELHLTEEVKDRLLDLQKKGININELLLQLLEARSQELAQEKEALGQKAAQKQTSSRYIPAATRQHLAREHGEKCSIETCAHRAENLHHSQRFALAKTHDPRYLAPLCKQHHKIAHAIDHQYHEVAQGQRDYG